MKISKKIVPFIPIIGIPLTISLHSKYGDTGIENNIVSVISSIFQAVSVLGLIILILI